MAVSCQACLQQNVETLAREGAALREQLRGTLDTFDEVRTGRGQALEWMSAWQINECVVDAKTYDYDSMRFVSPWDDAE